MSCIMQDCSDERSKFVSKREFLGQTEMSTDTNLHSQTLRSINAGECWSVEQAVWIAKQSDAAIRQSATAYDTGHCIGEPRVISGPTCLMLLDGDEQALKASWRGINSARRFFRTFSVLPRWHELETYVMAAVQSMIVALVPRSRQDNVVDGLSGFRNNALLGVGIFSACDGQQVRATKKEINFQLDRSPELIATVQQAEVEANRQELLNRGGAA